MVWKENLIQNILSFSIIVTLGIVIYCKLTKKTLMEFIIEIREAFSKPIDYE